MIALSENMKYLHSRGVKLAGSESNQIPTPFLPPTSHLINFLSQSRGQQYQLFSYCLWSNWGNFSIMCAIIYPHSGSGSIWYPSEVKLISPTAHGNWLHTTNGELEKEERHVLCHDSVKTAATLWTWSHTVFGTPITVKFAEWSFCQMVTIV